MSYPSTWQKSSDQPLTFTGQDEFLSIEIRQASGDPAAAAKALAAKDTPKEVTFIVWSNPIRLIVKEAPKK